MARLRPLRIVLQAVDKLTAPVDRVARRIDAVRAPVRRLNAAFSRLFRATGLTRLGGILTGLARRAAFLGGALAAAGVVGFKRFLALGDSVLKASQTLGLAASRLQELQFAAEQSDLSFGDLKKGLGIFVRNLGQANKHQGGLFNALKKTNPELVRQLIRSRDTAESFELIADAIANATTAEGKARIATAAFGKSGLKLIPLLRDGRAGLAAFAAEARRLNIIISDEQLAAAEELEDRWVRLRAVLSGLGRRVGAAFLPAAERLTTRLEAWLDRHQVDIGRWAEQFGSDLGEGVVRLADSITNLSAAMGGAQGTLNKISGIVDGIARIVDFFTVSGQRRFGEAAGFNVRDRLNRGRLGPLQLWPEGLWNRVFDDPREQWRANQERFRAIPRGDLTHGPAARVGGTVQVIVSDDRVRVGKVTKARGSPVDVEASTMVGDLFRGRLLPGY